MSPWLRLRKHLDRVVALMLSVVTAPVVAAAGILVRREDGGPALIRVPRMGRGGRPFGMWKLRSMRVSGADGLAAGPSLTSAADPRITKIGAHLRKLHLDELPQLYNVVAGQMTLVGPRPEAPDFVDMASPAWEEVLTVPPGILGPTQIVVGDWERELISDPETPDRYANEVLPVKLALDRWYLRRATPLLDLLTAVSLVGHLLPGRSAARLVARARREVPEAEPACDFAGAGGSIR